MTIWRFFLLVSFRFLIISTLCQSTSINSKDFAANSTQCTVRLFNFPNSCKLFFPLDGIWSFKLSHFFFLLFNYVIKNKKLQTIFLPETPIISLIWAMEQYIPFWKKKSQILVLKVFMTFRILGFKKNKLNFRGF